MMNKIAKVCEKRPMTVIGVVAFITVLMLAGIPKIATETEMRSFLPEGYPSLEATLEMENKFGGMQYELVLIESENVTDADTVKSILGLRQTLLKDPTLENYVIEVGGYLDPLLLYIMTDNGLLPDNELELTIQSLLAQPEIRDQVVGKLLTPDRKACLLRVKVNPELERGQAREKTEYFEDFVRNYASATGSFSASVTGEYSTSKELGRAMDEDLQVLVPAAAILIIAILALAFRRPSDVVLPFVVIGIGMIWVLGVMGHFDLMFSTVAVAIVPLLMGISIDYALHMTYRYREERSRGSSVGKSTTKSVVNTGVAVALTAGTTIIGFGSWLTSDLPPLRTFGFLCMLGILFTFILVVTLLPAFWVLRDRRKGEKKVTKKKGWKESKKNSSLDRTLAATAVVAERHPGKVLIAVGIITVIAIAFATQTTTAISFEEFVPSEAETIETSERIGEYFPGQDLSGAAMVLVKGDITDPALLATMIQLEQQTLSDPGNARGDDNFIVSSYSIADLILMANGGSLPENSDGTRAILGILRQQMPERIDSLITPDNREAVIIFMGQAETDVELKQIADLVRKNVDEVASSTQAEFAVGGMPPIAADLLAKIPQSALQTTLIAFILTALVLCIIFRSPKLGLIGMVPIVFALIWQFGAFYVFDVPLNVITVLISALLIGIGIDFSIHLAHRYREEWRGNRRGPEESIRTSVSHVGRAILTAATTTCGAFGILMLSRMPAMGTFGGMMALVILLCMLATLFVMPTLLVTYARRTKRE
jgi:hypothetical protein